MERTAAGEVYRGHATRRDVAGGRGEGHVSSRHRDLARSRNKYSYDPDHGAFVLTKVLPEGHVFPFDFGFIPQTKGEDGDPLDVLVMMDAPAFAGCIIDCRLIGVLQATQTKRGKRIRNDRYIAVANASIAYKRYRDIGDLEPDVLEQIRHFFISYNETAGTEFKPLKTLGAEAAADAIRRQGSADME